METKSKLGKFNWKDVTKGLILTFITALLTLIVDIAKDALVDQVPIVIQWATVLTTSGIAAAGYLLKNLGTDENDKHILEPKK